MPSVGWAGDTKGEVWVVLCSVLGLALVCDLKASRLLMLVALDCSKASLTETTV